MFQIGGTSHLLLQSFHSASRLYSGAVPLAAVLAPNVVHVDGSLLELCSELLFRGRVVARDLLQLFLALVTTMMTQDDAK